MEKCPKCDGNMEKGKFLEVSRVRFISDQENEKLIGKLSPVIVYRCLECGYCELYTKEKVG